MKILVGIGVAICALTTLVYALAGDYTLAIGVAALAIGVVGWKMTPAGRRGIAGGFGRSQEKILWIQLAAVLAGFACCFVFLAEGAIGHWGRDYQGKVALLAIAAVELLLGLELVRIVDRLLDERRGAKAEELVGYELAALEAEGWYVDHNVEKSLGGNIDHVAIWEHGAYAIETKSRGYKGKDQAQAIGCMMELREQSGVGWVTPVVCVPDGDAVEKGKVWVVGRPALADWLRTARLQKGRPLDLAVAAARLDGRGTATPERPATRATVGSASGDA